MPNRGNKNIKTLFYRDHFKAYKLFRNTLGRTIKLKILYI
jgi:hypothetical protein